MNRKETVGKCLPTETEATWTSVFASPCWICHVYYSTILENGELCSIYNNSTIHNEDDINQISENSNNIVLSTGDISSRDDISGKDTDGDQDEVRRENDEVLGWTMDAAARGVCVMGTAVFVSSDLLRLAKEAAGCTVSDKRTDDRYYELGEEEDYECQERVFGMKPSSILTNIIMLVGLLSAVIMPLVGSIIDHTPYRRAVGCISAAFMSFAIIMQMLILEKYWLVAALLQIIVAFSYSIHLCAVYAYLPELTIDHDKLSNYATRFSAAQYAGSVTFLLLMIGILSSINHDNKYRSSMLSQTLVFIICCTCFGYAWTKLFRSRKASQSIPEGSNLISAGFWKIYKTSQTIILHHSAIKFFLVSAAFTQAATTTFSTIAITYMTEQLNFTSRENGIAILILLLFGVPGTWIAGSLTKFLNPIRSLQVNLLFWMISILSASIFLYEPGQKIRAYVFAALWGLAIGWVYPTEKTLYVTIIPRGQEAELMGTYISACQMLSWLPPLVFTVMNELEYPMRIGLLTLNLYFFVSCMILFSVGEYDQAVSHAKEIDEGQIPFTVSPGEDISAAIGGCYEQFSEEAICHSDKYTHESDESVSTNTTASKDSSSG